MVFLAIAACFLVFLFVTTQYGNTTYRNLGIVALAGHVFVAVFVLQAIPYGWDINQFHSIAEFTLSGALASDSTTVISFATVQAVVYAIFGADPTNMSIVNGLLAVLVPLPAVYIARKLYGDQLRSTDGVVAAVLFLPQPFLFLTVPMRDALTTFLLLATLAIVVHTLTKEDPVLGLVIVPLLALLYPIRPELTLVLVLGLFAGAGTLFVSKLESEVSLPTLSALLGSVGALGFILFAEVMFSLERANAQLAHRQDGGAVYLKGIQYASWPDFLLAAPGRAIYFQFAPFPLHVETVAHALGFVSTVYVLVFVLAAARSLYACKTDLVVLVTVLVVYLAGIVGYGMIDSNFGTNVRHRLPLVFLLVVFAAPVIQRWELWVRQWFGVRPDEGEQDHGEYREARELDGNMQA